ncbi:translation initiation factor IF-2 [Buchnera aphidicola (Chaitoregma tattakana)]|uniref:translation initiation factor IF-2 n=1 Tax=Buchnera aphidicola TaxID=9 RepID=UPI0031B7FFA5
MNKPFFKNKNIGKRSNISYKKSIKKNKVNNLSKLKKYNNTSFLKTPQKNNNKRAVVKKNVSNNKSSKEKKIFPKNNFTNKFKNILFSKNKNIKDNKTTKQHESKNKKFFTKSILNNNVSTIRNRKLNIKNNMLEFNKRNNFINKNAILRNKKIIFIKQNFVKPKNVIKKNIILNYNTSILKLSKLLGVKVKNILTKLLELGIKIKNNFLSFKDAKCISKYFGYKAIEKKNIKIQDLIEKKHNNDTKLKERPPIVTIMGHVDHGKTSILDCIRSQNYKTVESGGITQNISTHYLKIKDKYITFLDTPGHKVFANMRSRGAQITDLIVLVVAADDGIMPQTIEAIEHAKTSNVPIIIAINKIDKRGKNIDFIKNELMKYEIISEELGGENMFVLVSAKFKKGINNLLEAIILQSEILELKTFYECIAKGIVVESFLDKHKGFVSIIIVQEGTLKIGDFIICDTEYGKIKSINDEFGNLLKAVTPSIPVRILGLSGIPISGSKFTVIKDEKKAKEFVYNIKNINKERKLATDKIFEIEKFLDNVKIKNFNEMNILIKADSQGSLEAIHNEISRISSDNFLIKIISSSVGAINETDVSLAITSKAIVVAFNVFPNITAKKSILSNNLDVRYYSVIYNLLHEIKSLKKRFMRSSNKNISRGRAKVKNVFKFSNSIYVAGCIVTNGFIKCGLNVKIIRNNKFVFQSKIDSIKHFKKDVKEVKEGLECGIIIKNFNKIKIGDVLEIF